jgi:PAS domain S-box-containing protein
MRCAIERQDWSKTSAGAAVDWPVALRTLVALILESGLPMFIAWGELRTLIYNDAYVPLLGHKHPAALGQPFFDVWREARGTIIPLVDRVFSGEAITMDDIALDLDRRGGLAEVYFSFSYTPIVTASGAVSGLFCVCNETTDATLDKRMADHDRQHLAQMATLEEQIAERTAAVLDREALIRIFFEHSTECHAVLAEDGNGGFRYEEINPSTLRLYRLRRDEVIGRTVDEVFDVQTADLLNGHLRTCLRVDAPYQYERIQGEGVIEAIATPVPGELGKRRRIIVTARDVTERRRLEQQLRQAQKMEAIGQLTGGLAHDFNNLLTGIAGALELLQVRVAQGRNTDLDRYVGVAQGAARRAAALTHRLLAFSRRQTLMAKATDVNRLIGDMEDFIRRTVGPEIEVRVVGAIGLWSTIVDPNQLENALLNVCINARDAMPHGGRLTIETGNRWLDERAARERELSAGQYISLCVSDTGAGMSPDVISRAFDPFFTTKPLGEGTGLGLSMIYGFARQSGGQARIYSEVGYGTMVCIYLPRHYGAVDMPDLSESPPDVSRAEQGETILVVDDEPTIRMLAAEVLKDLGYAVLEAADGANGLKLLESGRRIDLLVSDVGLPGGINGRQLADAARTLRPELKVLFITGYAENAVFSHGHLDDGYEVLTKPFAMEIFASRIGAIMRRH